MNRITLIFFALTFSVFTKNVQAQSKHTHQKCATVEATEHEMQKHPELRDERAKYEKSVQEFILNNPSSQKSGNKRIIPVVFHVIHECGPENISRAQILDQIRVMNEDFSLTNPNFSQTPSAFAPLAADCQIEFRLATKDDLGNCTDGIVRVYSPKTNEANNDNGVKSISRWNAYKYLNVWIVKSIGSIQGTGGEVLGYAQFPGGGLLSTDGVVIRHDCTGSIGTATNGQFGVRLGRTITHEIGHWLGLRHIWGDADCGSDGVDTTPIAFGPNYGVCWNDYPYNLTSCGRDSTDTSGEMFNNYMDYSDDQCMSMFTKGRYITDTNYLDTTYTTQIAYDTIYADSIDVDTITTNVDVLDTTYVTVYDTTTFIVDSTVVDSVFSYVDSSYTVQIDSLTYDTTYVDSVFYNETTMQDDTVSVIDTIVEVVVQVDSTVVVQIPDALLYVSQISYLVDSIAINSSQVIDTVITTPTIVETYINNTITYIDSINQSTVEVIDSISFSLDSVSYKSGQLDVMNATFETFRSYLISEENLIATGTTDEDMANPIICSPIANFCENRRMACADASISYTDASYNSQTYTRAWEFEGGTPATSTAATQSVTYANPGIFNVKLTASNDIGSNSREKNDYVTISGSSAEFGAGPFWDKLDTQDDFNRWITFNNDNLSNDETVGWEFSPNTGYGNWGSCVRIRNYFNTPTEADDLISPSYNVSSVVNPSMTFRIAGAETGGTADDALRIYTSTNCGQTWVLRKTFSGADLVTAGLYTSEFVPNNPNQWQTLAVGLSSISSQTNVRFRFELVAGTNGSNNIYIDDLNIGNSLGFENVADYIGLSVYPNPANGSTKVEFNTQKQAKIQIQLLNVLGQPVLAPYSTQVLPGTQNFNIDMTPFANGIYTVQLQIDSDVYYTKVVKN
jgi:PKD repeat protein